MTDTARRIIASILMTCVLVGCNAGTATVAAPIVPTDTPAPTVTPMAQEWTPDQLEIHVMAVDHGDAQLIVSPTGETLLIDGAREEFAARTAQYLREVLGDAAVDYLLVTHYHVDHIQGIAPLFENEGLEVRKAVLDRGGDRQEYDSDHYRAYYDYVTDPTHGLTRVRVRLGDQIDLGPRLSLDVLAVGDIDTHTNVGVPIQEDDNDNCIALWLTFGEFDYWTGGDLSGVDSIRYADIETAVIPYLPREADVYRANHHAIGYNSNPAFVEALNPRVTIASTYHAVADWNTVLRLEAQSDLYMTGSVPAHQAYGDIVLSSKDGKTYMVEGNVYTSK